MHIVYICNEIPPAPHGGIGTYVSTIAEHIRKKGNRVTIIGTYSRLYDWEVKGCRVVSVNPSLSVTEHLIDRIMSRVGYSWEQIEYWRQRFIRRKLWYALQQIHKEERVDIIEYPSYVGPFYRFVNGAYSILRLHGAEVLLRGKYHENRNHHTRAEAESAKGLKTWIGPTRWAISAFEKVFRTKPNLIKVIPNPVDCRLFHPAERQSERLTVLYVGTMSEHKGDVRLAEAANIFLRDFPSAHLHFVGRHHLERAEQIFKAIDKSYHGRVFLENNRPIIEIAALMRNSTILAVPSRGETFGNVYAEAMASGIPVVAGNNSGVREVVPNGVTGILVDSEKPDEIAGGICKLLGDERLRCKMGRVGRRIAKHKYSLDAVANITLDFYRECLKVK